MLRKPREVSFPSHGTLHHNRFTKVGLLDELLSQGWQLALTKKFWVLPDDSIHWQQCGCVNGRGLQRRLVGGASSFGEWYCRVSLMAEAGGIVGGCVDSDLEWLVEM